MVGDNSSVECSVVVHYCLPFKICYLIRATTLFATGFNNRLQPVENNPRLMLS